MGARDRNAVVDHPVGRSALGSPGRGRPSKYRRERLPSAHVSTPDLIGSAEAKTVLGVHAQVGSASRKSAPCSPTPRSSWHWGWPGSWLSMMRPAFPSIAAFRRTRPAAHHRICAVALVALQNNRAIRFCSVRYACDVFTHPERNALS